MNLLLITIVIATAIPDVTVLRWMSPVHSRPTGYREWHQKSAEKPWRVTPFKTVGNDFDPRIALLVSSPLYPDIAPAIDTLIADLVTEGYEVALFLVTGDRPESLRVFLQQEYRHGLVAATLIGNLPVAWFQIIDDWNSNGRRDPDEGYEEFPCDLYFMDLDGTWEDNQIRYDTLDSLIPGNDSIYDNHYGNVAPEIGIARIFVATIGNEDSLIRRYLARCHAYRTGQLAVTDRALVYIDDDWTPWAAEWNAQVGFLYPSRVFIADSEQTRVLDYRPRIDTAAYQWLQLCSHSWPGGHAMKYNHGRDWDWFYANLIPGLDPQICFYNLFACSNVRYVEPGYCGGRYVFQTATGLGAIGSTKTGSMLEFGDFYSPLSSGVTIAEAFRQWFSRQAEDGFEPWERSWFYGMCLIGDGLLKPRLPTPVAEPRKPKSPGTTSTITTIPRKKTLFSASHGILRDVTGRTVFRLKMGENDLSSLSGGIYFICPYDRSSTAAVVILR